LDDSFVAGVARAFVFVSLALLACPASSHIRVGQHIVRKGWISDANMKRTKQYFDRYGASTITIGRFVPVVRTIAPFVAGLTGMGVRRFLLFNVAGGVGWGSAMVLAGYWLGRVEWVGQHLPLLSVAIIAVSVVPIGVQWLRARRNAPAHP